MKTREEAMREVQEFNFAMIEIGLFLNTQPDCEEALALYEKVRRMHAAAKAYYEEQYGPLCYESANTQNGKWSWINGPWPWEGGC